MSLGICETHIHESATWKAVWTIDKFHNKDVEDLEHVVEYHDSCMRRCVSRILKGQGEVKDYLYWLDTHGLGNMDMNLNLRPKAKCVTTPHEVDVVHGNILAYGGISCIWQSLIGNGTASAGQNLTYFNNSQAAVGVGDSTTAAAATQTDLQASTNKLRVAMNATYPQQTDGVVVGAATITFQSTFGSSQGNYVWAEVGVFNSATAATGRMLNRLVQSLGTKVSGGSWSIGLAISLA